MHIVLSTLVIFLGGFLLYNFLNTTTGMSIHIRNRVEQVSTVVKKKEKRVKKRNAVNKTIGTLYSFYTSLPLYKVDDNLKEKLSYYALRLNYTLFDVKTDYKFIHVIKSTVSILFAIIVLIIGLFKINMLVLLAFVPFVYTVPDWVFDFIISDKNLEIEREFIDFYTEFYFPLIHKQNRGMALKDLALRYRDRAGTEMVVLIDVFRADCAQSEKIALANLKKNYKIADIHKFVDRISLVINGQGNAVQAMTKFKDELDHRRRMSMRKQVEAGKEKSEKVTALLYLILFEVVIAYSVYNLIKTVTPAFKK